MYKVKLVRDICIGAASCVAVSPKAFALDDQGKVITVGTLPEVSDAQLLSAAQSCPVDAIIIEDENGNKIWPKK